MRRLHPVAIAALVLNALLMNAQDPVRVGAGSYASRIPDGLRGPDSNPWVAPEWEGPVPTGDWWSSLVWMPFSERQYAHPLAVQAESRGLRIHHPGSAVGASRIGVFAGMPGGDRDLILGLSEVESFPDARMASSSDWFVTARFQQDGKGLTVSYGHGSPYVYAVYEGGSPIVMFPSPPEVWSGKSGDSTLGVTVGRSHYGLFGPTGSTWAGLEGRRWANQAGDRRYVSVAVLPDRRSETLRLFQKHAHAHVSDTRVEWAYDPESSVVTTTFAVTTKAHEPSAEGTLVALYPHQWRHNDTRLLDLGYPSVRGALKLVEGASFATRSPFTGVLPALPPLGDEHRARLRKYLAEESSGRASGVRDTYWEGKRLGKLASLVPIAEQIGDEATRSTLLEDIRRRLESWLSATEPEGKPKRVGLFAYDRAWGTLIGYPPSYGSEKELNDHHFHYGYFLRAAAEVARNDPEWAAPSRWGGMVELLIRDIASPDRADPLFPLLRAFDPYAGHSWASGSARFADGNNQESSSEAMNAWTALILWGEATGNERIRDLGIWLYTTERDAIHEYWFDVFGDNRPAECGASVVAMVWGGKGVQETWFSPNPEMVHGINWLPFHGGSLYLGHFPGYVRKEYDALVRENGGAKWDAWADLIWMFQALTDPDGALEAFERTAASFSPEAGSSKAFVYHWLHNLAVLGHVDRSVTANAPCHAVFVKDGRRAYVVYSHDPRPRTVRFSDGTTVRISRRGWTVALGTPKEGTP